MDLTSQTHHNEVRACSMEGTVSDTPKRCPPNNTKLSLLENRALLLKKVNVPQEIPVSVQHHPTISPESTYHPYEILASQEFISPTQAAQGHSQKIRTNQQIHYHQEKQTLASKKENDTKNPLTREIMGN